MAIQRRRQIGENPKVKPVSKLDTLRDTWRVMKPFVHFSVKALKVIAHALIFIVKNVPRPAEHKPAPKNNKVIKI